jgi:hypothetical protein
MGESINHHLNRLINHSGVIAILDLSDDIIERGTQPRRRCSRQTSELSTWRCPDGVESPNFPACPRRSRSITRRPQRLAPGAGFKNRQPFVDRVFLTVWREVRQEQANELLIVLFDRKIQRFLMMMMMNLKSITRS